MTKIQNLKKLAVTSAFGLGLLTVFGASNLSNAQAQIWQRDRSQRTRQLDPQELRRREEILRRQGWDGRVNRNGNVDLNGNGIDDRYEDELFDNDRYNSGRYDNNEYGRNRNDGYYRNDRGNYGYGNDEQRGYRDGFLKGREAGENNLRPNFSNSYRYQNGSSTYREAFRRGFFQAYRQYRDNY